jgi:simple sugar transport system permease protein
MSELVNDPADVEAMTATGEAFDAAAAAGAASPDSDIEVIEAEEELLAGTPVPATSSEPERPLALRAAITFGRWLAAFAAAFAIFAVFLVAKGANPLDVYRAMWDSIAGDTNSFGELLIQSAPFLLAGLAVAVPAKAGQFNIGGEGQLILGAIGAFAAAEIMGNAYDPTIQLVVMAIGGMVGGALWALIPALLKRFTMTSEAITSLLLNYCAILFLGWLVNGPWKQGSGYPRSRSLEDDESFQILFGNRVHTGIFICVIAAVVVWAVIKYTPWGFRLRVVGGNPEAARRAGFRVGAIAISAMVFGGALAGLAGMVELSGVEHQLRGGIMVGYGYIGFLASWLVKHDPLKLILSALLFGALSVGGNGLKSAASLSGAAVYILMSVLLLAILGWSQAKKKAVS